MMNIGILYFSGTGVTETYATLMMNELVMKKCNVKLMNITSYASRQQYLSLEHFDGLLFGFPVYADFAPRVINNWIPLLKGNHKQCGMYFTYGGRTSGYSHYYTKLLLEKAGFHVLCSAEFLGPHTFNIGGWKACLDRPNEEDIRITQEYINLIIEEFNKNNKVYSIRKPSGYNAAIKAYHEIQPRKERWATNPFRTTNTCSLCRACEQECPNNAFNADTGLSDPEKCIECLHCVVVCPDKVIQVGKEIGEVYPEFLKKFELTEELMNNKKSTIII